VAVVSVGDAVGVIVCLLLPPDDTPNTMSLIPYTKSAIAIIRATRRAPKIGEIKAMPEITTASAPTPTSAPLDHIGSFFCPTPAKMLEMPLNNRATAASVIL
jgi:hypothetical protein